MSYVLRWIPWTRPVMLKHSRVWDGVLGITKKVLFYHSLPHGVTCWFYTQERKRLYANYKSHHAALDSFPENCLCRSLHALNTCTSLEVVRKWNKAFINKYRLLNRSGSMVALFRPQVHWAMIFSLSVQVYNSSGILYRTIFWVSWILIMAHILSWLSKTSNDMVRHTPSRLLNYIYKPNA